MLGLLGGLLGRGMAGGFASRAMSRRPLGGLLAGRMARNAINPRQARPSGFANRQAPEEAEKPQPNSESGPVEQQAPPPPQESVQPTQQPAQPQQPIQQNAEELRQVETERQQTIQNPEDKVDSRPVTAGLLDEAPPAAAPQADEQADKVAPPPQVVNQTEALSPVAPMEGQQFGETPQLFLSGLVDRIGDEPPRRFFAAEDPVPTKQADVKSQARHTGNRPEMSFGLANAATSYTPNYSYRR